MTVLDIHCKGIRLSPDFNAEEIASLTAGFSGADLANIPNEAALIATRRGAPSVETVDFTQGIERLVGGLERKSRVLSPEEKKRVVYHEMGHTAVSFALNRAERVHKVSIIPRGVGALGYTLRRPVEDRYLVDRDELECTMATLLGGRAAESLFFKEASTGAADDLDKATEVAWAMVTQYGMSDALLIDQETRQIVGHAFSRARRAVSHFRSFVEEGVQALLEHETLEEELLEELWERVKPRQIESGYSDSNY